MSTEETENSMQTDLTKITNPVQNPQAESP